MAIRGAVRIWQAKRADQAQSWRAVCCIFCSGCRITALTKCPDGQPVLCGHRVATVMVQWMDPRDYGFTHDGGRKGSATGSEEASFSSHAACSSRSLG